MNATIRKLIPKCQYPRKVGDFKPISCCNAIYKYIAKIPTDRLKKYLSLLISYNQNAFVERGKIINNIMLAQEMVKDYSEGKGRSTHAIKIGIMKSFVSVNWKFMVNILKVMDFPLVFVN